MVVPRNVLPTRASYSTAVLERHRRRTTTAVAASTCLFCLHALSFQPRNTRAVRTAASSKLHPLASSTTQTHASKTQKVLQDWASRKRHAEDIEQTATKLVSAAAKEKWFATQRVDGNGEEEVMKERVKKEKVVEPLLGIARAEDDVTFGQLGIPPRVEKALFEKFNISFASEVQRQMIPAALSPNDLFVKDITGSGKTIALVTAIVSKSHPKLLLSAAAKQKELEDGVDVEAEDVVDAAESLVAHKGDKLYQRKGEKAKAHSQRYLHTLCMVPTRELALQLTAWIKDLSPALRHKSLKSPEAEMAAAKLVQCVVAGVDIDVQKELLKQCTPKILIGTPNRLTELYNQRAFDVSRLQLLVLDEVDRLVEARQRYDTVKTRFNKITHPLAGDLLLKRIYKHRSLARKVAGGDITAQESTNETVNINTAVISDPAKRRMQTIACSATLNNNLRRELTNMRGWMHHAVAVDVSGTTRTPDTLTHQAILFDKYGRPMTLTPPKRYQEEDKRETERAEMEPALPDTDPAIIETLAKLIHDDTVTSALVFVQSSISQTEVVQKLNALGIRAGRLSDNLDYVGHSVGKHFSKEVRAGKLEARKKDMEAWEAENGPAAGETIPDGDARPRSRPIAEYVEEQPPLTDDPAPPPRKQNTFAAHMHGTKQILVLTEPESRGLDLPTVTHVFVLGPPTSPASYVHMAGRAARFGKKGKCVTLLGGRRFEERMRGFYRLLRIEVRE
ncbi:P-loop containing nucleoside triphosphate hydrolase protein [Fimicolochytrium jonesii]|uniref:P-loop containing nucleoside triphosphate hydrolase protein n=1 Tax=Fimicolochytrium jonesii TaxID=1396493 RepID=UPI0022FE3747|nr:P-loop containing nucleoside triphosphate hydrolase protein [Fimicolochytrium jonesii]KAI8820255.1 P-loop containing nucleoside triphosphate hydrolase protein [Fimicolochytrium jonesii]